MNGHRAAAGSDTRRILRRKLRRDLRRRRAQILAVAGTVFLGIMAFTSLFDASRNLSASYAEVYERLNIADVWATGGPTESIAAEMEATPGVTGVEVRTRSDLPVRLDGRELLATVIGGPQDEAVDINRLLVSDGRDLAPGDAAVAVLEQHAADHFDLEPGDSIEIWDGQAWMTVEVVGVATSAEYIWPARSRTEVFTVEDEFAVVFVPEAVAANLAPDGPRQVVATVADRDLEVVTSLIEQAKVTGAVEVYDLDGQPSNLGLQADIDGFKSMSFLFPLLFLGVAGMATFVLLGRLVRQERTQIGMLMADGIASSTILRHYMTYSVVVSLGGAVPGILVGLLLGRWISNLYTDFLGIPITVIEYSLGTVVMALVFASVLGAVAGFLPARAAARIDPAESMRPPTPTGVDSSTLLERVWPTTLPITARAVLRNLARNPRRVATTATGVVLSLIVLVTSLALNDTVFAMIDRQFGEVDKRDLSVRLDHPVTAADLTELAAIDGIATVEPSLEVPVVITAGGARTEQQLQVFRADTVAHGFDRPLPDTGVVLGSLAREELDVVEGDDVMILIPGAGPVVTAPVAGFVSEMIPSVSYTSLDAWLAAGGDAPTTAVVTLVDHDTHDEMRDVLAGRSDTVAVTDHRAMVDTIRELLSLTIVFVGLMVAFAILMTVGLLFNAVTVALAERTNEMATLQANGMPRRWIRTTVTAETVLVVVFGLAPGLVLGWIVAGQFLGQFDTESFRFDLVLSPGSFVLAVGLVIVVALVSEIPGLRRIERMDLPSVVRERSV